MPIDNLEPVQHPTQDVLLNRLAMATIDVLNGDMIDAPGGMAIGLRPWAEVETEAGATVSISAPNLAHQQLVIDDIDAWVKARYAEGNPKPAQLMALFIVVVDEENKRQHSLRHPQQP